VSRLPQFRGPVGFRMFSLKTNFELLLPRSAQDFMQEEIDQNPIFRRFTSGFSYTYSRGLLNTYHLMSQSMRCLNWYHITSPWNPDPTRCNPRLLIGCYLRDAPKPCTDTSINMAPIRTPYTCQSSGHKLRVRRVQVNRTLHSRSHGRQYIIHYARPALKICIFNIIRRNGAIVEQAPRGYRCIK
jgi:hypothetical protein